MSTIGAQPDRLTAMERPMREVGIARRTLIWCGAVSSLLYVGTDIVGGMKYAGYSFASQAVSELGAIGAPSKPFVDPLFLAYDLLALAFGIGLLLPARGKSRALWITGAALIGYGAVGFIAALFNPFFAMQQRGAGSLTTDAPHIALTGVIVLFLLLAIGSGAFALGKRFRAYSLATLAVVIVSGVLTIPFASRVAAGQPTPGLGIVERIDIYSALLWLAILSIALRQPSPGRNSSGHSQIV